MTDDPTFRPTFRHRPVMLAEVTELFAPVPAGLVIDATLGGGGHAGALLEAHPHLRILGVDQDDDALAAAAPLAERFPGRFSTVRARFDRIADLAAGQQVAGQPLASQQVVGVLFDLGVSSPQLDRADRGFSYRQDAPLDMRMDRTTGATAADVVNTYDERELADVLRRFGDERFAGRIARAIVAARPVTSTVELAEIVRGAIPAAARRTGGHPAKRSFQAIRIEVNRELDILPGTIDDAISVLAPRGRIAVLSYHSGEDRIVKDRLRQAETGGCTCPPGLPCVCGAVSTVRLLKRGGWTPSAAEVAENPRAESARLRAAERLPEPEGRGVSPAQAAEARSTRSTRSTAAPARGPQRPKIVPVREAEQPKGRIARLVGTLNLGSQLGRIGTLVAVALFVSVFGVVIFQTLIVQGQARLDNLNGRAAAEEERSRDLHQQVADLEAPARIVETARNRLGMVPSGPVGYLSPSADDADKSAYVAPPPTTTPPATTPKTTKKKPTTTTTTPTTTAPKKSTTTTTPKATTP